MKCNYTSTLLGAVVLFVWGMASWMILPWHNQTFTKFTNEPAVVTAMMQGGTERGMYMIPGEMSQDASQCNPKAPRAFIAFCPQGMPQSMPKMMSIAALMQLLLAGFAGCLLSRTSGLSYWKKVCFVSEIGLMIGIAAYVPMYTWFGFTCAYTVVGIIDTVIGFTLAGLVIAKFSKA